MQRRTMLQNLFSSVVALPVLGAYATSVGRVAMRMNFSNEHTAQAAAGVLERYGYRAFRSGTTLEIDCPTLLAVPVVHRVVGFDQLQEIDIAAGSMGKPSPASRSFRPGRCPASTP